jgi:glc operon protein GlcG
MNASTPASVETRTITLAAAQRVVDAAVAKAGEIGFTACVAVADAAGHLIAFSRMNGAPLISIKVAQDKAYSVAAFGGVATHEWWGMLGDAPAVLAGIDKIDRLIIFGGGVPIVSDGVCIGALGVSGGSADQDRAVAESGAAAI